MPGIETWRLKHPSETGESRLSHIWPLPLKLAIHDAFLSLSTSMAGDFCHLLSFLQGQVSFILPPSQKLTS